MLDTISANELETWGLRLWRLLTAWEAALDSDPIECQKRRASVLERGMHGLPLQRANGWAVTAKPGPMPRWQMVL